MIRIFYCCFIIALLASCKHEPFLVTEMPGEFVFNFIGHPRMEGEGEVNPHLLLKNWKAEGPLLIGGDVDYITGKLESTIQTYDSIFDFKRPSTMLAFGNHDYQNLAIWENYTNRKTFYTEQLSDICVFVADTQIDKGSFEDEQKQLLETVLDTLETTTTFVLLTHKLIWLPGHPILMDQISTLPNGGSGDCGFCTSENNFYADIYPMLKEVQESGIQVICLAGDLGNSTSFFEFQTEEGIQYLANGWNYDSSDNEYIKFYQSPDKEVFWEVLKIEQ